MRYHDGSYRSTREAFPAERYPAVFGPYRPAFRHRLARAWRLLSYLCLLGLFAALGVMLAWRG